MEPEQTTLTSAGQETPTQTAARARKMLEPTVSATQLAEDVTPVTIPVPEQTPVPTNIDQSIDQTLGSIRSQSETARQLEESNQMLGSFVDGQSAFDLQDEMLNKFGVTPEALSRRGEIGEQLARLRGAGEASKLNIESGGQSSLQGLRSLTQQDRETAVMAKTLEAEAAALDGQLQLGRQLAGDAVNLMLADRDFTYKNLIRQNNALQGQVDEETRQLLIAENREHEAKLAEDQAFEASVKDAIGSGAATGEEMATLTAPLPTHPDPRQQEALQSQAIAERQALAQSITARGAGEMRDLQVRQAESSLATDAAQRANIYDQISQRQVARNAELVAAAQAAVTEGEKKKIEDEAAAEGLLGIQAVLADLENAPGFSSAVGFGVKKSGTARTLAGAGTGAAIGAGVGSVVPIAGTAIGAGVGALGGGIAGFFAGDEAIAGSSRADFEVQANRLSNMFLVENLDKMSGVLTDKDLEVLRSEGTTIGNFDQSEESWLQERDRLVGMVERGLQQHGITEEQAQYYLGVDDETIGEANALWGG